MIRKLTTAAAIAGILVSAPAVAASCRDAKGKFMKCPPAAAASAAGSVTKDKNGRCHVASGPKKGQFIKCK